MVIIDAGWTYGREARPRARRQYKWLCFICLGMDWHDMVSGMIERFSYDLEMQTREQSRNN